MANEEMQKDPDVKVDETEDTQESLIQEVETLRAKVAELTDAYLRLRADFDNYRRRTRQEMETIGDEANAKLIEKLLPVLDDLDRALLAGADSPDRGLYSGVELVQRKLTDILCQEGLQPVPGVGSPFDPNVHEAIACENADAEGVDVVVDELRRGYLFKDRLVRSSMVKTAKRPVEELQADEGDDD
ncbi:MAG: nucleotide exchange factor GrpE [Firmicutes bacterium]|mgnify:CR=1 FL=1|nr:nucleotide exchange factor GrpE [Bacillota bacterium]